ncbi:hypothetical protein BGY98DRAFT_1005561 [Russula aff. rugulosa BPL654]|nr:hypothetical protein BGY98DRAFT_1005561 [Russula aff. rugulosa BPL654]
MIWSRALPRAGIVASGAVAGVVATECSPQNEVPQKLSIYPELEREIVVVESPSVLETQIGVERKAVKGVA